MAASKDNQGVYSISVTARMVGMEQHNLRQYESRGLLEPDRTSGGTRLYSDRDVAVLRRIGELLAEGLNLAGVRLVLQLEARNRQLRRQMDRLKDQT
ncbi:MerR family transcriptional regulator [Citricoccus sp. I39-566]|uniref:MerR family transcriptional regulator n=1 Tax=Citricoccus sp. I39-566 TaxID=3073268 RepID=UPI00286A8D9C|nr:MerR family transcriptional regulator [Citricoccus sp. I39-566]WMY79132.1 MerR family transcriptional regulator [Citricoccus sp. I39-566]